MINDFAMNPSVTRQLKVIRSLQARSEDTVQSLYAQAVLEYSLYHYNKNMLYNVIDEALTKRDKELFEKSVIEYNQLIESHREGKTVSENGFELYLHFE
ncbi:IDEAL domain-containing protein [Halalkalibacter alkalisediminis]|uniref:IDEAL domain-containing protein n=1 Tax=Halalkalibacter alkalisediminis TaxID=935616 RepID=A0ABV6NAJ2_9BACI|nr:IDEAL domain-containing protein [Halalkalibacter alkalisediminis]